MAKRQETSEARSGMLARFGHWLDARLHADPGRSELDGVPVHEVVRIAQDLGLSESDLRRLDRLGPDRAQLLYQRLQVIGLDMTDLIATGAGERRDLERTCALCDSREMCSHDLGERPDDEHWRRYCPNEAAFAAAAERLAKGCGPKD